MGRSTPKPPVFGITLTPSFIRNTSVYIEIKEEQPDLVDGDDDMDYRNAIAVEIADQAAEVCPARLEYVDTKCGIRPCIVLAIDQAHAEWLKSEKSDDLKKVYQAIGMVEKQKAPNWYECA